MRIALFATLLTMLLAGCGAPAADDAPETANAPTSSGASAPILREDFQTFALGAEQDIEWKYRLEEGGAMQYSWSADRPVRFDFHGDRDDGTDDFVSHRTGTLASDEGSFRAPFAGRHGWYFANPNSQSVTITLEVQGELEVVGRTGGNAPP